MISVIAVTDPITIVSIITDTTFIACAQVLNVPPSSLREAGTDLFAR